MNFGVAVGIYSSIFEVILGISAVVYWASSGEIWGGFGNFSSDFWGDFGHFYRDVLGKFR